MLFCIRDDDTSFFTSPGELERAYGQVSRTGPVSLAIVPFCRAGTSKGIPDSHKRRWSVHPLHENRPLVEFLRQGIHEGRFEAMLHGYHHDEPGGAPEFVAAGDLSRRVAEGRRYLEDVLGTTIRVFVPPHNAIGREGLRAIAAEGLHLAGTAGVRGGWPLMSARTWATWMKLRRWRGTGTSGIPWVLDLGDHREIPGTPVTPESAFTHSRAALDGAIAADGVFCAATHYWELDAASRSPGGWPVGEHLRRLIDRATTTPGVEWCTVGHAASAGRALSV